MAVNSTATARCHQRAAKLSQRRALFVRLRHIMRWCMWRGVAAMMLTLIATGWWAERTGRIDAWMDQTERAYEDTRQQFASMLGLTVQHVYLEGRDRLPLETAMLALDIEPEAPILSLPLETMRERLEIHSWVRHAELQRMLPDSLHVRIVERQPLALWQRQGTLHLIDQDGEILHSGDITRYTHLPVVVGEDAPEHTYALLDMLADTPEMFAQVSAAIRVGGRRWNIRFYNGSELLLPEKQMGEAWRQLITVQQNIRLLKYANARIDMRQSGRVYILPHVSDGSRAAGAGNHAI